jgi:hypothetical protein
MSEKAFPVTGHSVDASGAYCGDVVREPGMDLLDYFAAHAMQGLIAMGPDGYDGKPVVTAITAYEHAEEMMKERAKRALARAGKAVTE